jgi:hypothetical protein
VALPLLKSAYTLTYQNIDRGILELYGPHGIYSSIVAQSESFKGKNTGFIFRHLFIIISALTLGLLLLGG